MRNRIPTKELKEQQEDLRVTLSQVVKKIELLQLSLQSQNPIERDLVVGDIVRTKNTPFAKGVVYKINKYYIEVKTDAGYIRRARKNLIRVENGNE